MTKASKDTQSMMVMGSGLTDLFCGMLKRWQKRV